MSAELIQAIQRKQARVVVIGLGYVGIPVACMFARVGFRVTGLDVVADKVGKINACISPIEGKEPGLPELIAQVVQSGYLCATTDPTVCREADVVLISVETPVDDETKVPHYNALRAALTSLGKNLKRGSLIIVESTIAPRTMEDVVKPTLEQTAGMQAKRDFYLVHCPERVMPGRLLLNIETMSRVVGGMTPEATQLALAFYRHVVKGDLDPTDALTAELVKTTENAYRDVQIAFANEVALVCEAVGGDVWKVREFVNKSPGRYMLLPGAGVGGHCIPKDPWLLIYSATQKGVDAKLTRVARGVNDGMPLHVADLVVRALREAGKDIRGARIAVLGYAYLENSDDTRNSPSEVLLVRLREQGAEVRVHDPYVHEYRGDVMQAVKECDVVAVMVAHDDYKSLDLAALKRVLRTPILMDARNVFDESQAENAGLIFFKVGQTRSF